MRILVLGGTGFIGRHAAGALRARGHTVVIATRHPKRALAKLPPTLRDCDLRELHLESLSTRYVWKPLLEDIDVVLNCSGLARERGSETWDRVLHMAPAALAEACRLLAIRLVHLSQLGLRRESPSAYLRARERAERAIAASGADYHLVRPGPVVGDGNGRSDWLRRAANWPVHLIPTQARGQAAALRVEDLAEALAVLCTDRRKQEWREVELGGPVRRTLAEQLDAVRDPRHERAALRIPVPGLLALGVSLLCDAARFSAFSFAHLELMRRDALPGRNLLPELLGRSPLPVGQSRPRAGRAVAGVLVR